MSYSAASQARAAASIWAPVPSPLGSGAGVVRHVATSSPCMKPLIRSMACSAWR
jgi:hypothetical protein